MSGLLTFYLVGWSFTLGFFVNHLIVNRKIDKRIKNAEKMEMISDKLESRYESDSIRAKSGSQEEKNADAACNYWSAETYANKSVKEAFIRFKEKLKMF